MKFTCTKENFLQGIQAVVSITGKAVHLPILNNILLIAETTELKVVGTNLELSINASVRSKVELPGAFTVPARTLVEYISLLPAESRVECELEENELVFRVGRQKTKLKGVSAAEFPVVPVFEKNSELVFSADQLKKTLTRVLVSVSHSEVRPELQGVFVFIDDTDRLRSVFASTDSYRLSEARVSILKNSEMLVKAIIPQRAAQEICRLLPNTNENVTLCFGDGQVSCVVGDVQIISRLVDGVYPDYRAVIPKNWNTEIRVLVDEFGRAIKAASLFATQGVNAVSLRIKPSEETLVINSASSQMGEHSSEMAIDGTGEENQVVLNHRYLIDGLSAVDGGRAVLRVVNAEAPCVLLSENSDDYLYIIMPIRQ